MKSKYILLAMSLLMFIQFGVTAQVTAVEPKELLAIAQISDDAINTHNADLVLPITTDDMVWDYVPLPTPFIGNKAFAGALNGFFKSFPDMRVEHIRPPLVSGNIVVVEHWATGTQLGEIVSPLGIIPPTGKNAKAMHMDILDFEGNKIKKSTTYDDMASQFMQLGILPPITLPEFKPSFKLPAPEPTKLSPMEATIKQESLWNAHDFPNYAKMFSADADIMIASLGTPMNRDSFIASQEMYVAGFPDIQLEVVRHVDMGDGWVLSEEIYKGTNTGSYLGLPPTGRPVAVRGGIISRVNSDGLVTNMYIYWDHLTLMAQLGMLQSPSATEANKELVKSAYYEECWNKANFDAVKDKFDSDYVFRGPGIGEFKGFTAFTQLVTAYRKAFPDMLWTLEDQIAEGDLVVSRMTGTGTNLGDFMGVPATGKKMITTSISIIRIEDGKIKESWTFADMLAVMQQLGLVPPSREKYDWGAPSDVVGDLGDLEANKAVVMRYIKEFWNQKKLNVLDEIANPNIVSHAPIESINPIIGIETNKKATQTYISAFPDLNVTVDDFFAEGDKVIERWTAKATHQGAIMGIPPTGKAVVWTGFTIYRLADGKIVEIWWAWDALGLMQQLTAKPETPEGYDNVFFASLSPGLNMISLPLKPITPYTAKSFATEIDATVVIKYNEVSSKFEGFSMNTPGNGFTIEGGKGYIVNVPKGGTVAFTGAAWTNEPPVNLSPSIQSQSAWAFMVNGLLLDGESMKVADRNYTLTVKNLKTRAVATEMVDPNSGYFNTVWADMNRKAVVKAGDKLEITVTDSSGKIVSGPFVREISLDEIRNALIDVRMKLGDIIPDKSLLLQNYPNPFNPETWLPFYLKNASDVIVKIYSSNGQLVKTLDLGHKDAGIYVTNSKAAYWDGKDEFGEKTASGIYFYTIYAGKYTATGKMLMVK